MEHDLCEAAIKGDTNSLDAIILKDPLILHKFADGCFHGAASPLHVATSNNRTHFVKELLHRQPELTEVLDSRLRSALHLASAKGHDEIVETLLNLKPELKLRLTEVLDLHQRSALHLASGMGHHQIVKVLVEANPKMCVVCDRDGKNPVHVAAMEGKTSVLKELVQASPQAARVRVDQNETILHLCVKHNQLGSLKKLLKLINGCDFVNAKNSAGNTILHLAILYEHFEIARYVLGMETKDGSDTIKQKSLQKIAHVLGMETNEEKETIDVNATNASGHTAMDILFLGSSCKEESHDVHDLLLKANAKQAKDLKGGDWLTNKRASLMVVASLIATMAFQAGVTPPGGVWQEDSDVSQVGVNPPGGVWQNNSPGHRAGEAVMAFNHRKSYTYFLSFNTIGFVASLSTILLLVSELKFRNKAAMWFLIVTMWLAITSMAITYAFSNVVVTPKKDIAALTSIITIGVIVWSSVMALLLVKHTFLVAYFAKERSRKWKAMKRIKSSSGGKGRGASPPIPV